ncbi:hypothetical protein [Mesorhizobium sp. ES1-4]|uniref:hypothetical protein n=1 Tax=Mesorhizobium sp. ES1-4 TaxID=2876627 RepID=UPI001CCACCB3|nr:hypothetical protein [Mesorhizobium sp. ES1-4]MBZ9798394.1 hypothetical protein [Mesorhizobium sp. ES1-4]
MHDLIDFLRSNAALVLANPTPFATFAILFGSGGFVVGRYFLTERIANLESRLARRDDEIKDLKSGQSFQESDDEHPLLVPVLSTSFPEATPMSGKMARSAPRGKTSRPVSPGQRPGRGQR